jgi:hypothetical protein
MRPRFLIGVLVFALVVLAVIFWLRPTKAPIPSSLVRSGSAQSTGPQGKPQPMSQTAGTGQTSAVSLIAGNPLNPSNNTDETRELRAKQAVERLNVPVRFYGMVIDQDSNALSGVRVKLGVRHGVFPIPNSAEAAKYEVMSPGEFQRILNPTTEVVSDTNGRFQWVDPSVTGDIVGVGSLTKDGYEAEPGQYSCGAGEGRFDSPVIFKMWSTNVHEHLISGNKAFDIVPDGRPYFINLTDGTLAEAGTGDLKVWIKRPEPITSRRYDWSCEVEVINGGLLRETNNTAAMFRAPAEGYTNSFTYEEGATANGWGDTTGQLAFFVRLKNGQEYGRISIELEAYYNTQTPGLIRLSYAINPSGSLVLR